MKAQEIFDKVALHLLNQGRRSTSAVVGNCAYRGKDGLMCAVGVLIPNHLYQYHFDEEMVPAVDLVQRTELREHIAPDDMSDEQACRFLRELQSLHDMAGPEEWGELLIDLAYKFDLSPKAVVNFLVDIQDQN